MGIYIMFNELSKDVCKFTKNPQIRWVLVLVLILYVFSLDQFVTREGNTLLKSTPVKLLVLLLIILLADRDPLMAILLAVSYLVSLHSIPFLEGMEGFNTNTDTDKEVMDQAEVLLNCYEKSNSNKKLQSMTIIKAIDIIQEMKKKDKKKDKN